MSFGKFLAGVPLCEHKGGMIFLFDPASDYKVGLEFVIN